MSLPRLLAHLVCNCYCYLVTVDVDKYSCTVKFQLILWSVLRPLSYQDKCPLNLFEFKKQTDSFCFEVLLSVTEPKSKTVMS